MSKRIQETQFIKEESPWSVLEQVTRLLVLVNKKFVDGELSEEVAA